MAITYRLGSKEDVSIVLDFLRERTVFPGYIGYESPETVREVISRSYRAHRMLFNHPKVTPLLIALDDSTGEHLGYAFFILGIEETITNEAQTWLYDYYVTPGEHAHEIMDHFLDQAEQWTEENNHGYIITEVPITEQEQEEYFASRGYHIEMNRIVKKIGTYTFDTPRQKKLRVRPATGNDRNFILLINAENSPFLIPFGRDADEEQIRMEYFELYSSLSLTRDPQMKVLVCEDIENYRPVGYIMIRMEVVDSVSAKPLAYIYDVNVHKDYWGAFAGQRLVKEAENMLHPLGIEYLIGDTSQSNPRPLKTALKTLGFKLYSRRWVRKIRVEQSDRNQV